MIFLSTIFSAAEFHCFTYSPTTVKPSVEATALNLVCVVDPEGTYMVLVVPAFLVTKEEQADTTSEPI